MHGSDIALVEAIAATLAFGLEESRMVLDELEIDLPRLLRARSAAEIFGISLRTWQMWNSAGRIPRPIRIGRCPMWRVDELREWVDEGCPPRREWESRKKS